MAISPVRYTYDPLDRLFSSVLASEPPLQRFYQSQRLATEIQGDGTRCVFQCADQLLAQRDNTSSHLLITDLQRSVLGSVSVSLQAASLGQIQPGKAQSEGNGCSLLKLCNTAWLNLTRDPKGRRPTWAFVAAAMKREQTLGSDQETRQGYSPYGQRSIFSGLSTLLGFNGERPDPASGHYLLGNGYRAYNPVLMRFNSPDSLSPFEGGGINAYAYCSGDPLNREDSTGYVWKYVLSVLMLPTGGSTSPVSRSSQSTASTLIPAVSTPVALNTQAGRAMRPLPDGLVREGLPMAIVRPVSRPVAVPGPAPAPVPLPGRHPFQRQAHVPPRSRGQRRQVATDVAQQSGGSGRSTPSSSSRDSTPPISREPSPSNLRTHPQLRRTGVIVDIEHLTTGARSVLSIRDPNAAP